MYALADLGNMPIFEQLQIEEALLRADGENWCLINSGTPPAIVMGISGKPEKLIDVAKVQQDGIPLIKRFSGGGTVYVDQATLFVTLITNGKATPKTILEFSKELYAPFFPSDFDVRENDYVFGDRKFGGNAQYIQKARWLHHTSFLWDFDPEKMRYLLLPEKRPAYRNDRSHHDFLTSLSSHYTCKADFLASFKAYLKEALDAEERPLPQDLLTRPHRTSSQRLNA